MDWKGRVNINRFENKVVIYLSPHLDDAVLSNGGCIRLLRELGVTFMLINIFTKSIWTSKYKDILDKTAVSNIRKSEDMKYCKALGLKSFYMGIKDSSLRGYDEVTELVKQPIYDDFYNDVKEKLTSLLQDLTYDYLFVPLALGGHIDHFIVFDILSRMKLQNTIYYEDIPYAYKYTDEEIEKLVREKGLSSYVKLDVVTQAVFDLKIEDVLKYESQIEKGLIHYIRKYTYRHNLLEASERLWVSSWKQKENEG